MRFRDAVGETPGLDDAYRRGLQALKRHDRARIACQNSRDLAGSIYLEQALPASCGARWDYGIGVRKSPGEDRAVWVEVHPASSTHVETMLGKLAWLKRWLGSVAPSLKGITNPADFVWVSSGKVNMPGNSPQRRRIAAAGLQFAGERLRL